MSMEGQTVLLADLHHKANLISIKLDRIEGKLDRVESKLDAVLSRKQEGKLPSYEQLKRDADNIPLEYIDPAKAIENLNKIAGCDRTAKEWADFLGM